MSEEETGKDIGEEITDEIAEEPANFEDGEDEVMQASGEEEDEYSDEGQIENQPALVINVHSWATPVVGLLMLVVGLLVGYLIHPLIPSAAQTETPLAVAPANTPVSVDPELAAGATQPPANLQEVMDYLKPQVRHFKGDPEAAVTIIEFSDFQ